eukprot:s1208_g3.t1
MVVLGSAGAGSAAGVTCCCVAAGLLPGKAWLLARLRQCSLWQELQDEFFSRHSAGAARNQEFWHVMKFQSVELRYRWENADDSGRPTLLSLSEVTVPQELDLPRLHLHLTGETGDVSGVAQLLLKLLQKLNLRRVIFVASSSFSRQLALETETAARSTDTTVQLWCISGPEASLTERAALYELMT